MIFGLGHRSFRQNFCTIVIMKKTIALLLACLVIGYNSFSQTKIPVDEASSHIGDTVTICSKVMGTKYTEGTKDAQTFIYLGANTPDAPLVLLIWPETRRRFDYKPEKDLLDREICVTGIIENANGKAQITVTKQDQIKILPKSD
jgi:hypothetical protein